eukprot:TRINITY_DN919_c0_g1_i4.p2 TRINITY_DN919_c0_g1~~TRINITY_DN919_c0_g1_i4.p2  ORF type:complete len:212 (+),score=-20.06 TRINITY_DN919_c0_g1_i4:26-637(+)
MSVPTADLLGSDSNRRDHKKKIQNLATSSKTPPRVYQIFPLSLFPSSPFSPISQPHTSRKQYIIHLYAQNVAQKPIFHAVFSYHPQSIFTNYKKNKIYFLVQFTKNQNISITEGIKLCQFHQLSYQPNLLANSASLYYQQLQYYTFFFKYYQQNLVLYPQSTRSQLFEFSNVIRLYTISLRQQLYIILQPIILSHSNNSILTF